MSKETKLIPQLRFPEFERDGKWATEPLENVYSFLVTNSFSRAFLNYDVGNVKNIHYGDIHTKFSTQFDITKEEVPFVNTDISLEKIKNECYCKEGDIVFADASEDLDDVGKSIEILNLNGERLISGLHTLLARQKAEKIKLGFGGFLFKSPGIREQIKREAQGAKVLGISGPRLSQIVLAYPKNKQEQQKIAACLSSLDELLAAHNDKLAALKDHKKGLLQNLFPRDGETVPRVRFPEFEGDEGWTLDNVNSLFDLQDGYPFSSKVFTSNSENGRQVIRITDINNQNKNSEKVFIPEEKIEELNINAYSVKEGDLLLSLTGAAGFNFYLWKNGSAFINQRTMKITPKDSKNEFLKALIGPLIHERINEIGTGQNNNLSKDALKAIEFPIPQPVEQQKIAACLSAVDELITAQQEKIEQLKEHKKGLMQGLFPKIV